MKMNKGLSVYIPAVIMIASLVLLGPIAMKPRPFKATVTPGPSSTPGLKITPTQTATSAPSTPTDTSMPPTSTDTALPPTATDTGAPPTATFTSGPPTLTPTPGAYIAPYVGAPLCPDSGSAHELDVFHTLWDSSRGCHYDHEHGASPFMPEVSATFPGFSLIDLLGGVEIGHTDPSSPTENVAKHGGFKWQVDLNAFNGCALGFEGGQTAINAIVQQIHEFGRQDVEFEVRKHSAVALMRMCRPDNPTDYGYLFVNQLQEYGQRITPYQGSLLDYPDNFQPTYDTPSGPYFTTECIGLGLPNCRASLQYYIDHAVNNNTIWTSKPSGLAGSPRPETSRLYRLLFSGRDAYQVLDSSDLVHPFTWRFICGNTAYNPVGCRYNNSTATVFEIAGDIPASWDGLAGWDTDSRPGRITAEGFVTKYGLLNMSCTVPDPAADCYPIKMVGAFVGKYSSQIRNSKLGNLTPLTAPERDIYFCSGVVCGETDLNAVPSGWIGAGN